MIRVPTNQGFLSEKISRNEVLLVEVLGSPLRQVLRARILRAYGVARFVPASFVAVGAEIEFVHAPDSWGNTALQVGQTALVFLSVSNGRFYEEPWNGHLVIQEIQGDQCALYGEVQLWQSPQVPETILTAARPHPQLDQHTAIRLPALEDYLVKLIGEACGVLHPS